jgi:predicted nucleic acid-binding protein
MILYLGTSSIAKLYVEEKHSDAVREWVRDAEIVATCRVAYTEMISALEIRFKQNDLTRSDYDLIVKRFSEDWLNFAIVDFDERQAGFFIKKYGLRRFDAIHLSAAKLIERQRDGVFLTFSSVEENLCRAAVVEGLKILSLD